MLVVITGAQMVTCIMHTRIGITVFGGTVAGSIGRPLWQRRTLAKEAKSLPQFNQD
jgi:hypothetical protein